jgi:hypothetical protein
MKEKLFIAIKIVFFLVTSWGCCTKKYCEEENIAVELTFSGYAREEVDSVLLNTYYDNKIYSSNLIEGEYIDSLNIFHAYVYMYKEYSYSIEISSIQQQINITPITTIDTESKCNNCILRKQNYDNKVIGYNVNSIQYYGNAISIYK